MKQWQCTVCGYIHHGEEPPEICPVCGADRSLFVLLEEEADAPAMEENTAKPATNENSRWRCSVCGYIHTGIEPPDICPVCGADKSQFVLLDEEAEAAEPGKASPPSGTAPSQTPGQSDQADEPDSTPASETTEPSAGETPFGRFSEASELLTQYHGHPIAVHIPNGVLPLAVLFSIFAALFNAPAFATAAKYNIVFVALAMPVVIGTGLIDWVNKYKRRMTKVFRIKMICAGIVALLTLVLAVWWIVTPGIYQDGLFGQPLFYLLHLLDLGAAVVAGWYGGKLVFH